VSQPLIIRRRRLPAATVAAAILALGWGAPPAPAAEEPREAAEAALAAFRAGSASFERTVVVDIRYRGGPGGDVTLHARYTELHQRESARRSRTDYRGVPELRRRFSVVRHDGDVLLAVGTGPFRTASGALKRLLAGYVPTPLGAPGLGSVAERVPAVSGDTSFRHLHVAFRRPDLAHLLGTTGREAVSGPARPAVRASAESAEVYLDPDGRLARMTQRFRATLDNALLARVVGLPLLGPQGVTRIRASAVLQVLPSPPALAVERPAASGTVSSRSALEVPLEDGDIPFPAATPRVRGPVGNRAAIALARRANRAVVEVPALEAALRPSLGPRRRPVIKLRLALEEGLIRAQRLALGRGPDRLDLIALPGAEYSRGFDEACWDRGGPAPDNPFTPFRLGEPPIPLEGSRFFAPEGRGRVVRIVLERTGAVLLERFRYALDRRTGRLLAVEGLLYRGRVRARAEPAGIRRPGPVCASAG
jgi:hypothetical protein